MDKKTVRFIQNLLTARGYEVTEVLGQSGGCSSVIESSPDIIITDPYYNVKTGLAFLRAVREQTDCPIIAVSAAVSEKAKIDALDCGADDFIKKPIQTGEFLARIRVILRRIEREEKRNGILPQSVYSNNGLEVDFGKMTVKTQNRAVHLTKNEFKILALLCRYQGRVLSYDFIMKTIWGANLGFGTGILRVNVTNIRKKIGEGYIITENGVGYKVI
ncbi:MAG: response regulator transcription factor [Clostridia bacterium]|nr:response regulator transcription factor [Clostridia bacterium]